MIGYKVTTIKTIHIFYYLFYWFSNHWEGLLPIRLPCLSQADLASQSEGITVVVELIIASIIGLCLAVVVDFFFKYIIMNCIGMLFHMQIYCIDTEV